MVQIFFSYSHQDEPLRAELEKHLSSLRHQGLVNAWHDRRILAGEDWADQIDENLRHADIILLLVSADFIASSYCYDLEMKEALRRHEAGEARVIPVILRPCDWQDLPFGKLQAATKDGRPVTKFPTLDDGFLEVVRAIKAAALSAPWGVERASVQPISTPAQIARAARIAPHPRSSDLRVKRTFSDHDRDAFLMQSYEYIAEYFDNSLQELTARNAHLKTQLRRRDANSFEATIYAEGKQVARAGIWLGNSFSSLSIAYSSSGLSAGNSFNESISVADDGFVLGLKPLGMSTYSSGQREALLTQEGAAEYYWKMLIERLQ